MERIVGMAMPSIRMRRSDGEEIDIAKLVEDPAIVYLYPGDEPQEPAHARTFATAKRRSGKTDEKSRQADHEAAAAEVPTSCSVQRASFREYALDFAALGVKVLGISSEPHQAQKSIAAAEQLPFSLLSDVECSFADALSLPTLADGELRRYRRATLICKREGVIGAVFYPVSPKRSAMQALAWLEHASR